MLTWQRCGGRRRGGSGVGVWGRGGWSTITPPAPPPWGLQFGTPLLLPALPSPALPAQLVFAGLGAVVPLLSLELLKFPKLCRAYFALLAHMLEVGGVPGAAGGGRCCWCCCCCRVTHRPWVRHLLLRRPHSPPHNCPHPPTLFPHPTPPHTHPPPPTHTHRRTRNAAPRCRRPRSARCWARCGTA